MNLSHLLFEIRERRNVTDDNTPVIVEIEGDDALEIHDVKLNYDGGRRCITLKAAHDGETRDKLLQEIEDANEANRELERTIDEIKDAFAELAGALRRCQLTEDERGALDTINTALRNP